MNSKLIDRVFLLLIAMCCIAVVVMGINADTSDTQWTSIHDELPAPGEVVNICTKDQDVYMAMYQGGGWVEVDSDWEFQDVTCWAYKDGE